VAYASTTEIQAAAGGASRLVQLLDWDNDGAVDTAVLEQLQLEVDSWIDSYAGRRYAVPLADPSAVLRQHAADEVVYRALLKRNMVHPEARDNHAERVKWLEMLARGHVVPSDPHPAKASSVRSAWVSRDTDEVSREKLKGAW
jgi:phage gp36-like protein